MIDIPIGKALVAVEINENIDGRYRCNNICEIKTGDWGNCISVNCDSSEREDGKNVIFKLVDYKGEGK